MIPSHGAVSLYQLNYLSILFLRPRTPDCASFLCSALCGAAQLGIPSHAFGVLAHIRIWSVHFEGKAATTIVAGGYVIAEERFSQTIFVLKFSDLLFVEHVRDFSPVYVTYFFWSNLRGGGDHRVEVFYNGVEFLVLKKSK